MVTPTLPVTKPPPRPVVAEGAVVRAEHLTKRFAEVVAVDDLSFAL